jgi:predicted DNA-binding transcriptional regulator YafY
VQAATVPVLPAMVGVDADLLMTLAAAIRDRAELRFDYEVRDRTVGRRTVEPYRLVPVNRRWYLLAWDTGRRDWRTLRVDRIGSTPVPGARFRGRDLPEDPAGFVVAGVSSRAYRFTARVTLHAPAAEVTMLFGPATGQPVPIDEHTCELRTGADSLPGLAFHLANVGVDFTVHEPPELREHLAAMGRRMLRGAAENVDTSSQELSGE